MTRSLIASREGLKLFIEERDRPETRLHVADATNEKSAALVHDTMKLAFELMALVPDRAEGITLQ